MTNQVRVHPERTPTVRASDARAYITRAIAQSSWGWPRRSANCLRSITANTDATSVASSGKTHMPARIAASPLPLRPDSLSPAMSGPRLLFSTAAFFARPLDDTFRLIADCGYSGVEVLVTGDPASQDPTLMRASADRHGLQIGALHDPSLLFTRWVWGSDRVAKIERAIAVATAAEVPLVVTHPPYRWQRATRTWFREEL